MRRIHRILSLGTCILAAAASTALAQTSSAPVPSPTPAAASPEERIQRLEKLLGETRAELAELKAASGGALDAKLAEIERRIDILAQEIEAMKIGEAAQPAGAAAAPTPPAPTPGGPLPAPGQRYGLGLSASKVYGIKRGVSIGGYGEVLYENFADELQDGEPSNRTDRIDFLRAVVYLGYKFDEHWVLNTEIEYEHAVTGEDAGGEVAVEFAYIDYMHSRPLNARAGLVLVPMGLVNELHEPTSFLGARRPDVERFILPTTWRELGVGIYGDTGFLAYRGYLTSSLDSAGFSAAGIRGGRQAGAEAIAENWAFAGRLDYTGTPGLLAGASVFAGKAGQSRSTPSGLPVDAPTTVFDLHADWQWRGLWLRALYAHTSIGDAERVNEANGFVGDESVGSQQEGWYVQAAYDVFTLWPGSKASLLPYVRYEEYDTQKDVPAGYMRNPANDNTELTLGLAWKPIDRLILKADWQQRHNAAKTGLNQFNLALGYIF